MHTVSTIGYNGFHSIHFNFPFTSQLWRAMIDSSVPLVVIGNLSHIIVTKGRRLSMVVCDVIHT